MGAGPVAHEGADVTLTLTDLFCGAGGSSTAVTPPAARDLIACVVAAITGQEVAA